MPSLKKLSKAIPNALVPAKVRVVCQFLYGALFQYGWLKSLKNEKPVDSKGNPLPWFSYPCIDFLQQLDLKDTTVFEWGAGHSTFLVNMSEKGGQRECYRVMRTGGTLGVVTPDITAVVGFISQNPSDVQREYLAWFHKEFRTEESASPAVSTINAHFRM